jgi:hypothetical protein
MHSAAAPAAAHSAVVASAHDTPSPPSSSQANGCEPPADAMRMYPRCHASRGGQCASGELLGSFGGQLLTDRRVVWRGGGLVGRPTEHSHQLPGKA